MVRGFFHAYSPEKKNFLRGKAKSPGVLLPSWPEAPPQPPPASLYFQQRHRESLDRLGLEGSGAAAEPKLIGLHRGSQPLFSDLLPSAELAVKPKTEQKLLSEPQALFFLLFIYLFFCSANL